MSRTESVPNTRLSGKEHSPLVIRRYSTPFLHWVAIIADENLDSLDELQGLFWERCPELVTIQDMRNAAGDLTESIAERYPSLEGAAVIFSADKLLVSSLYGDFMVHAQCRLELYSLLAISTQV